MYLFQEKWLFGKEAETCLRSVGSVTAQQTE